MTEQTSVGPVDSSDALGAMPTTSSATYAARSPLLTQFDRFASSVTRWAGSPVAFCAALFTVAIWAAVGPVYHFSENWQLVINTGTTIVTFLMVFLIQQSQNKGQRRHPSQTQRAARSEPQCQQPNDRHRGVRRTGPAPSR